MTPPPLPADQPRAPVPVTVIGGFLGAGKTTLLNHVLASGAAGRAAVIVNDVGEVSVDAALIERHEGDTIALTNGCICCSLSTDFALALPELAAADPPFDRVLIEASGVSDPGAIAQYGTLPGFRLDGVLVLADAETIRALAADPRIGTQVVGQLERADLVLLTKADLIDGEALAEVRAWMGDRLGPVPMVDVHDGRAPLDIVFGAGSPADPDRASGVDDGVRPRSGQGAHGLAARTVASSGTHDLATRTVPIDRTVTLEELRAWLVALPEGVLRIKGIVEVADVEPPVLVNAVGRRRRAVPAPWLDPIAADGNSGELARPGHLVLIAHPTELAPITPP